jgi:outer membrane protein insertion porin family
MTSLFRRVVLASLPGFLLLCTLPFNARGEEKDPSLYGKPLGEIRISELRHTKESLVRGALYSKVGELYGEKNEAMDRERLDRLGVFSSIAFTVFEEAGGIVLDVEVKETTPWVPLITADITDADGLTLGPGVKVVNLLGRGIYLSASARFGQAATAEVLSESPWIAGGRWAYRFQGRYRDGYDDLREFDEKSLELDLLLGKPLANNMGYGIRLGFLSLGSDVDGVTLSEGDRDETPSLGIVVGYDNRDLWSNPHEGWLLQAEVRKNGGVLGGDGDWWSLIYDVRRYQPIRPRHTLQLASYATFQVGDVGTDIPSYQTFFIGGTNSVRGWDTGSREGKNELLNTFEYRWDVKEPKAFTLLKKFTAYIGIQVALLADVGLAWDDQDEITSDNIIGGVGAGIRLLIPFINVLRFDVAYGERGASSNLHIGGLEKVEKQRERIR